MKQKESHSIRNGIIATFIGGVLLTLWPPFLNLIKQFFTWFTSILKDLFSYLSSEHSVYGWVIVVLAICTINIILIILPRLRKHEPGVEDLYTKDHLFGVDWEWNYMMSDIINLWCICPICKSELIYSEFIPDRYNFHHDGMEPFTEFICEKCSVPKAKLSGPKNFAISTVEREIRRKIRIEEWKK